MSILSRQELFNEYIDYFRILDQLGKGIMIKPQLQRYILKFNDISKDTFARGLRKLEEVKLISVLKTRTVSIIGLTNPAVMLLRNKGSLKKVSASNIWTNRNLKQSTVKNQYIIEMYLEGKNSYDELKLLLDQTNLMSKVGDNACIIKNHLQREKEFAGFGAAVGRELKYLEGAYENKKSQLKGSKSKKSEITNTEITLNNLQSRHIYFKTLYEAVEKVQNSEGTKTYSAGLEMIYMEVSDLLGREKFERDMDALSSWISTTMAVADAVCVDVVVEPSRAECVAETIKEWHRKRLPQFCLNSVYFQLVEVDIRDKYYRGLNIAI